MADLVPKRRAMALEIITEIDAFMGALTLAKNKVDEAGSAGLTFVDGDFTTSGLEHCTASSFNTAMSNVTSLMATLVSGSIDDVFNAVRPN